MDRRDFLKTSLIAAGGIMVSAAGIGAATGLFNSGESVKIIAINGSPRKNGNTATMCKHFLEGATSAGSNIETSLIHLSDYVYKGCISCFSCKRKTVLPMENVLSGMEFPNFWEKYLLPTV